MRFEIVQGDEQLSSHSGLVLVGALLDKTNIRERLDKVVLPVYKHPEVSHGEVAISMVNRLSIPKRDSISALKKVSRKIDKPKSSPKQS